jgi:hypothetical protein
MREDRARHIASFAVIAFFLALNTATSKSGGPYGGPIPPPAVDAAVAKVKVDAGPPTIADLPGQSCSAKTDLCRILADFSKGTTPIDLPATGSDLWAGYIWGGPRQPFFMKIQRGYTPAPDPALEDQVMDDSAAFDITSESDGDAWIATVKDGKPALAGNRAFEQAHGWSPTDWFSMAKATSGSIALLTDRSAPHVFLRTAGTRLLVVLSNAGKPIKLGKVESGQWVGEMWKTK